ncbi:hypothetical protein [Streptomyces sp. NPDC085596]|uniref:hypothetical protein n=1 Tax=Streptomyces sp. NPDC085596 TaxID=3365731 RepID=UPI0037CE417F
MRRRPHKKGGWPAPRTGTLDLTCPAPSITPGYPFTLTLTGTWGELPSPRPHHNPAAAAANHALTIARNITSQYSAADAVFAAARINTHLGRPADIPHLPVRLSWAAVHLSAEADAQHAALTHQRHLGEEQQRQTEQQRRLDEARTLRDTLLTDPSLALAYWFTTAPQTTDSATLTRLEELLATTAPYAPQGLWVPLARLLHTFADHLSDEAKIHLIDTLAALTDRYGRPDITTDIRTLRTTHLPTDP